MSKKSVAAELTRRVREAGLRRTGPRLAVLERLAEARQPLTHGELFAELKERGFDQATIYRNLMDLTEAQLVARTDAGDHVWRFELRGDGVAHGRQHPHFLCTSCGKLSCLTEVKVQLRQLPRGLQAAELEVQLKGVCDHCRG